MDYWNFRFESFSVAFLQLKNGIDLSKKKNLTPIEKQGLIRTYEFTFNLSWKMMRDYLLYQERNVESVDDVISHAHTKSLIHDLDIWSDMLAKRKLLTHSYNDGVVHTVLPLIQEQYFTCLEAVHSHFLNLQEA